MRLDITNFLVKVNNVNDRNNLCQLKINIMSKFWLIIYLFIDKLCEVIPSSLWHNTYQKIIKKEMIDTYDVVHLGSCLQQIHCLSYIYHCSLFLHYECHTCQYFAHLSPQFYEDPQQFYLIHLLQLFQGLLNRNGSISPSFSG